MSAQGVIRLLFSLRSLVIALLPRALFSFSVGGYAVKAETILLRYTYRATASSTSVSSVSSSVMGLFPSSLNSYRSIFILSLISFSSFCASFCRRSARILSSKRAAAFLSALSALLLAFDSCISWLNINILGLSSGLVCTEDSTWVTFGWLMSPICSRESLSVAGACLISSVPSLFVSLTLTGASSIYDYHSLHAWSCAFLYSIVVYGLIFIPGLTLWSDAIRFWVARLFY